MDFYDFAGNVMLFADATTPDGWLDCDGRIIPIIKENELLFYRLGSRFGGDGRQNFALPNLPKLGTARYIICVKGYYID